jgi:hypothetical protein
MTVSTVHSAASAVYHVGTIMTIDTVLHIGAILAFATTCHVRALNWKVGS